MNTSHPRPAAKNSIHPCSAGAGVLASLLLGALLAACGQKAAPGPGGSTADTGQPPMASSVSDDLHYDDPCSLLEPKEVEAVLGEPLGTPPFRGGNSTPRADGEDCIYQTATFHEITLNVVFTGGAQSYRITGFGKKLMSGAPTEAARKAFMLDDGTELTGEWDEAQLTAMNCCIFNALRGDQMITIDFTGSEATLRQAAGLVDAAFKRIDKPLKIDGASNVAAAKAFAATRPKPRNPCDLLTRAEAEAVLGTLIADPKPSGLTCSYQLTPQNNFPRNYELNITWRGGYAAFRSDSHVAGLMGKAMGGGASSKSEDDSLPKAAADDPWERGGVQYNDFVALKKDVRIKIDQRMLDREKTKALVTAAMRKI